MMSDVMKYKDYIGSVHYGNQDAVFFGKIEGINDLITFEGQSVDELNRAFEEAVDDYLELCALAGKEARKVYKGTFNVRIVPELHKRAAEKSMMLGISLNQLVRRAIEKEVGNIKE